jgi:cyclophilin family peptidyl-prolyl cis-trans isomerase
MIKKLTFLLFSISISIASFSQYEYPDVVIETNKGTMKLMLYDNTFRHSENFIKLVNSGYYNGMLFHRVIKDFMIQTGDDQSKDAAPGELLGRGGKKYTIPPEIFPEYYHKRGAVAAARQPDNVNPKKESSGSQFYIVQGRVFDSLFQSKFVQKGIHPPFTKTQANDYATIGGSPHLDYEYTVFGEVYEGLDIVEKISLLPVDKYDRPIEDVVIQKMYTIKNKRKRK